MFHVKHKDSARSKYLHTMHDTLNFPNANSSGQVDGQLYCKNIYVFSIEIR